MNDTEKLLHDLSDLAKFPEMNPGAVCRMDKSGTIVLANKAARKLFGSEKIIGQNWKDICPGFNERLWDEIARSVAPLKHERQISECIVLFTFLRPDESDFVFAYGNDVTAFRQAESELAEQTRVVKEIARFPDMNPGPVLRMDFEGIILLANAAAQKVFGENLVGRSWKDIFPGMESEAWDLILNSTGIISHEAHFDKYDYVFAHRCDPQSKLIFVYGSDITLLKKTERALLQSEKMATLGTLAAGVAHELNNPAAATKRAADHLRGSFARLEYAHILLNASPLVNDQKTAVQSIEQQAQEKAKQVGNLDPLTRSDRESEIEEWLEGLQIDEASELSPSLVGLGFSLDDLGKFQKSFSGRSFRALLLWASNLYLVYTLLNEIGQGSSRISEIVGALKNYSYLGQAPVQSVNIHEGIDNTLVILRNKLKTGIAVHREYYQDLPPIVAYGSELNQVWTNLIDNAADALKGKGEIVIRTMLSGKHVQIEIEDNGPGIPKEIQSRIFDPFFTTKDLGKGTGLGLSTTYGIVTEKHHGEIAVESREGMTRFTVTLPIEHSNLPKL